MSIDQMCNDARGRLAQHVNRSAGQHSRAMKARQTDASPTDRAILGAVALNFKVSDADAFRWLVSLDAKALQKLLIDEISQGEKE